MQGRVSGTEGGERSAWDHLGMWMMIRTCVRLKGWRREGWQLGMRFDLSYVCTMFLLVFNESHKFGVAMVFAVGWWKIVSRSPLALSVDVSGRKMASNGGGRANNCPLRN